jgi:hypothetical protein
MGGNQEGRALREVHGAERMHRHAIRINDLVIGIG